MSYLLYDPALLSLIQAEVQDAFNNNNNYNDRNEQVPGGGSSGSDSDSNGNIPHLLEPDSCPRLNALFDEVLRLTNSSSSVRSVSTTTTIQTQTQTQTSTTFRAGMKVIIPYRQLHFDENIFGQDTHCLKPDRFLTHKSLNRHPSYRPFGGGSTYCPGRFIARQEVVGFVAFVLRRFCVRLARRAGRSGSGSGSGKEGQGKAEGEGEQQQQRFPSLEEKKPCLGVMGPAADEDLIVEVSLRAAEAK